MILFISLLLISILNILLGLLVLYKNPRNQINVSFTVFVFSIVAWMISNYFSNQLFNYELSFALNKLVFISASYIVFGLIYFAIVFPRPIKKLANGIVLFLLLIPVALSNLLVVTNQVISGITSLPEGGIAVVFEWGAIYYALHFLAYALGSLLILGNKYFRSVGFDRAQLQYLWLGLLAFVGLASITNLIIPLMLGQYELSNYGPLLSIFTFGFTAYAILRHRLMDIRLVVARTVAYTLLITVIGVFYVGASFLLSNVLLGLSTSTNQSLVYAFLTLIVALTFGRLRVLIQHLTDGIFFKGEYDSHDLLSKISYVLSNTLELETLGNDVLNNLLTDMRITKGAIILLDQNQIYRTFVQGVNNPNYTIATLTPLLSQRSLVVKDHLEDGQIKDLFTSLDISVARILSVKDELVGILLLGDKSSGEIYSDKDIKLIEILGPELAVAIANAKSFDKIKQFNQTLSLEIKKATADLSTANIKLKELDRLKDDFVSVASHELRTPMTAIRSYSWMALHKSDTPLSPKLKMYLDRIHTSTERLINLVNDMLNISRIESGRVEINPVVFEMPKLVSDVFAEIEPKANEKKLHLVMEQSIPPKVFADPDKVHQVLLNLLGNALKFTPAEGTVSVSFFTDGQVLETKIKDSGVGISKEDLSHLFTKFGRLDNSYVAAATSGGTGLGLYICKIMVEMMGGKIWAQSAGTGQGSEFIFSVPLASAENIANPEKYANRVASGAKVLEPVAI